MLLLVVLRRVVGHERVRAHVLPAFHDFEHEILVRDRVAEPKRARRARREFVDALHPLRLRTRASIGDLRSTPPAVSSSHSQLRKCAASSTTDWPCAVNSGDELGIRRMRTRPASASALAFQPHSDSARETAEIAVRLLQDLARARRRSFPETRWRCWWPPARQSPCAASDRRRRRGDSSPKPVRALAARPGATCYRARKPRTSEKAVALVCAIMPEPIRGNAVSLHHEPHGRGNRAEPASLPAPSADVAIWMCDFARTRGRNPRARRNAVAPERARAARFGRRASRSLHPSVARRCAASCSRNAASRRAAADVVDPRGDRRPSAMRARAPGPRLQRVPYRRGVAVRHSPQGADASASTSSTGERRL